MTTQCPRCSELCEELSEQVSDQIDPSVNVPWMRGSPDLPKYIFDLEISDLAWHRAASMLREGMGLPDGTDLYECLQKFDELKARFSELEAKCAEMRKAIAHSLCWIDCEKCTDNDFCEDCRYQVAVMEHALSSDCGKDYVPRSELDAAKAEVERLRLKADCWDKVRLITPRKPNAITWEQGCEILDKIQELQALSPKEEK